MGVNKMKKGLLITGLCLAVGMSTMLASCGKGDTKGFLSAQDAYGFGAVSTIKLLGSETSAAALASLSQASEAVSQADTTSSMDVKQHIGKFNEYFTALDSFLNKDVVSTTSETNSDALYSDYQTKLTIKGKDFDGNDTTYVMYYNETFTNQTVDHDDGDEVETIYHLTGVMVVDGKDYHLIGERSEEVDRDEQENELKIRAYADLSNLSTYVEMQQENSFETDETETEYVYSIYNNGQLIEKTEVEFGIENENNSVETEYELEFISGTGRGRYSIERELGVNTNVITVEYVINNNRGKFTIREIETGNEKKYEYTFSDGTTQVF